ncbi:MAG: hypothetical protein EOP34_05545 [Rickettsiales bacterium]|nr:MAG: hypothetical protein EOP34_05545 [Rickettsiales bacterium]
MAKNRLKTILNKLHFKSSIISQTSFKISETSLKVSFHNCSSSSIIVYEDVFITKKIILEDNKHKCGIYKWANMNLSITNIGLYMTIAAFITFYFSVLATF